MRFAPEKSLLEECFLWMNEKWGCVGVKRKERFNAEDTESAETAEKKEERVCGVRS
jgi:hypothetical protein